MRDLTSKGKELWLRWYKLIAYVILAAAVAFALSQVRSDTTHVRNLTRSNTQLIKELASERHSAILDNCRVQNKHYTQAFGYLDYLYKVDSKVATTPAAKASLDTGLKEFRILIQDLQPKQNCQALVHKETTKTTK